MFFSVIIENLNWEILTKKGGRLGQFSDLRGRAWRKRGGWIFYGELIPL